MEVLIIPIIIIVFVIIFISNDAPKRGMSSTWAFIGLFALLGLIIYLASRKPLLNNSLNGNYNPNNPMPSSNIVIPDTCPHCHNPNNRKTRLCEWCGNQIV